MIERQLVLPVPAESLWDAITDPAELGAWFGSTVEWELRPGAPARFDGHDGSRRLGLVTEVRPGRHLRFRWWNESDGPDSASEVTYDLDADPDGDGTRLVVTERPVDAAPDRATPDRTTPDRATPDRATSDPDAPTASAQAHSATARSTPVTDTTVEGDRLTWTSWDARLLGAWAIATSHVSLTAGGRR